MDELKFQPLEPEYPPRETEPDIPNQMDALEDQPVIQELSFEEEAYVAEDPSEEPETIQEIQDPLFVAPLDPDPVTADPDEPFLSVPEVSSQIEAAEHAMDAHGMLEHGKTELSFDFPTVDEPEFPEEPAPLPAEDPIDQAFQDDGQDFESMFQKPAAETEKKQPLQHSVENKGRPKRKKGEGLFGIPSILVTFVWLALILIIGVTAGRMLWICAADVLAFGREDKVVTVTVYESDTMEDIINKLHDGGLIRYKSLFHFYADISDAEEDIKPGIYDLNTRYDYHALVNFMSPPSSLSLIHI